MIRDSTTHSHKFQVETISSFLVFKIVFVRKIEEIMFNSKTHIRVSEENDLPWTLRKYINTYDVSHSKCDTIHHLSIKIRGHMNNNEREKTICVYLDFMEVYALSCTLRCTKIRSCVRLFHTQSNTLLFLKSSILNEL